MLQGAAGSTQTITMVTEIRGLRGVSLGQRGRLERQLTEKSALALDDSSDSSPQGFTRPAIPRDGKLYRTGMWLAAPFSEEQALNRTEAKTVQYGAITH